MSRSHSRRASRRCTTRSSSSASRRPASATIASCSTVRARRSMRRPTRIRPARSPGDCRDRGRRRFRRPGHPSSQEIGNRRRARRRARRPHRRAAGRRRRQRCPHRTVLDGTARPAARGHDRQRRARQTEADRDQRRHDQSRARTDAALGTGCWAPGAGNSLTIDASSPSRTISARQRPTSSYQPPAASLQSPLQWRAVIADFLIHNTSEVLTCAGPAPRRGSAQADAGSRPRAVVAAHQGVIVFVGDETDWRRIGSLTDAAIVIDAHGGAVVPGFVDPHTHVVFAGDRRDELRRRLGGATYAEITAAGGGIVNSVRATRAASSEQLVAETRRRLDEMLSCGTTTCEAKSGYALTVDGELKLLRVLRALASAHAIEIAATFMGAHDVPIEYRDRRGEYVDLVVNAMIPAVARERLA